MNRRLRASFLSTLAVAAAVGLLAGCGGGGTETAEATLPPPPPPPPPGPSGSASLSWTPPTQREDGSSLSNLSSYKIHYGTNPDRYSSTVLVGNPSLSRFVVEGLGTGTYYFTLVAVDSDGVESASSNIAQIALN